MLSYDLVGGKLARQVWHNQQRQLGDRDRRGDSAVYQRSGSSTADRRRVAHHESAHAVASLAVGGTVGEIAIDSDGGGSFRAVLDSAPRRSSGEEMESFRALTAGLTADSRGWVTDSLVSVLAPLAFELARNEPGAWGHCSTDVEHARLLARGVADDLQEQQRLVSHALDRARAILLSHYADVLALGDELFERQRMNGDEVRAFLVRRGSSLVAPPLRTRVATMNSATRGVTESNPAPSRYGIRSRGEDVGTIALLTGGEWGAFNLAGKLVGTAPDHWTASKLLR
jgi:hypothetical protein